MEEVYLEIWNEIKNQAIYIPQAVIIAALFFMSYMFISDNKGQVRKRLKSLFRQKWIVAFLGYAAFLSSATIMVV